MLLCSFWGIRSPMKMQPQAQASLKCRLDASACTCVLAHEAGAQDMDTCTVWHAACATCLHIQSLTNLVLQVEDHLAQKLLVLLVEATCLWVQ